VVGEREIDRQQQPEVGVDCSFVVVAGCCELLLLLSCCLFSTRPTEGRILKVERKDPEEKNSAEDDFRVSFLSTSDNDRPGWRATSCYSRGLIPSVHVSTLPHSSFGLRERNDCKKQQQRQ
jgi:hypothetical protein